MYAPLIAVYQPIERSAAERTNANAIRAGSRRSPRGGTIEAKPATSGRIPMPRARPPAAHVPYVQMRSLYSRVMISHSCERLLAIALNTMTAPTARVIAPIQSQRLHVWRQARIRFDCQPTAPSAIPSTATSAMSWDRSRAATIAAARASSAERQVVRSVALRVSQRASVESVYASGSSTTIAEYESAGAATAPIAAATAQRCESTLRAIPYAGKIAAVITIAPAYLTVSYASWTE